MPENIDAWWARRQRSKGVPVPYARGQYRAEWSSYPMLVRQYHPEFNRGIVLSQIPPAAEVYLVWQCDAGHFFVATPAEQRGRPGGRRRRSAWCPLCSELASPTRVRPADAATPAPTHRTSPTDPAPPARPTDPFPPAGPAQSAGPTAPTRPTDIRRPARRPRRPADTAGRIPKAGPPVPPGTAFFSARAPKPASAAEADLRRRIGLRLDVDLTLNAVAVGRPFHGRLEVWPDIVLDEFRVAIEYDTAGRFGLEHVGPREHSDRRKDALLREARWDVVRIRCRPLRALGPHDLETSGVTDRVVDALLERLRELRGDLFVNAYLR